MQAEADLSEEIPMRPTNDSLSKNDKNRIKNIRFTFAPTNSNVSIKVKKCCCKTLENMCKNL